MKAADGKTSTHKFEVAAPETNPEAKPVAAVEENNTDM